MAANSTLPQEDAIILTLQSPLSTISDWKTQIPTEKAQAIFATNLSAIAYTGNFNLQEIIFGNDRALITSFIYGVSFFYFDIDGNLLTEPIELQTKPNIQNPLNPQSIPKSAVLMLVCTFNSDRRTNDILESLHAYNFDGFVVAQPGIAGNNTNLPQIQAFAARNYFIAIRGSQSLPDFLIEFIPNRNFSIDLSNAIPTPLRNVQLFYANNAVKLYKNLLQQNATNPIYNNPFYPLGSFGRTGFQRNINEVVVVGHSLGGSTALAFVQLTSNLYPSTPVSPFTNLVDNNGIPITLQNFLAPQGPILNFTGNGINYRIVTFGSAPPQILPFNRNIVNQGTFQTTFVPVVTVRNFVNDHDPVATVEIPTLRILDGIPAQRLFNETIGYYLIRNITQSTTTDPNATKELVKIRKYNYISIPIFYLLSTDHNLDEYMKNLQAIDVDQFEFTIKNFYFAQSGIEYQPNANVMLINTLARLLPQNYFLPVQI